MESKKVGFFLLLLLLINDNGRQPTEQFGDILNLFFKVNPTVFQVEIQGEDLNLQLRIMFRNFDIRI